MSNYPINTKVAVGMESLIKHKAQLALHERMSSRMVKCASILDRNSKEPIRWPVRYSTQFAEMIKVFQNMGAEFRAVIGSASLEERSKCKKDLFSARIGRNNMDDYIGRPVRARILIMEPEVDESMVGIEVCEEKMKPIPVSHKNTKSKKAVVIGKVTATTGMRRKITIGEIDIRRHYQIIGQTGTGKSTLLSTVILSAIEQGHGLTFFDPHGSTIDNVLRCIPEKYIGKVRVVRIGDAENPVPLNIWDSDDPAKEERTISDLCELFSGIFDPYREGFVGPRYERWLSTFCKASIAFLGRRGII